MRFDQLRKPWFTDLAVVLGQNVRWVENDYEDLQRFAPEVLLGYRVRLAVPDSLLLGYDVKRLILLTGLDHGAPRVSRAIQEAVHMTLVRGGTYDWYSVTRGFDPVVVKFS